MEFVVTEMSLIYIAVAEIHAAFEQLAFMIFTFEAIWAHDENLAQPKNIFRNTKQRITFL